MCICFHLKMGGRRVGMDVPEGPRSPPGGPQLRPESALGGPRRVQEATGGGRRSQEAIGGDSGDHTNDDRTTLKGHLASK